MRIIKLFAEEIWKTRLEHDLDGDETHDWYLAKEFIEQIGTGKRSDLGTLREWYLNLEEIKIVLDNR